MSKASKMETAHKRALLALATVAAFATAPWFLGSQSLAQNPQVRCGQSGEPPCPKGQPQPKQGPQQQQPQRPQGQTPPPQGQPQPKQGQGQPPPGQQLQQPAQQGQPPGQRQPAAELLQVMVARGRGFRRGRALPDL